MSSPLPAFQHVMDNRLSAATSPPATRVLDLIDPRQMDACADIARLELQISRSNRLCRALSVLIEHCRRHPFLPSGLLHIP
jgi:hypothetical protein